MFNLNMRQIFLGNTINISAGRIWGDSPWFDIILFVILIIFIIILTSFLLSYRINNTELKKVKEDNKKATSKYKELESLLSETMNTNLKMKQDNSKLKEINDKLKKIAFYDKLTDLPNKEAVKELLDGVMLTLREGEKVGVLFLNIDDFRQINNLLGNTYGDELLIDITHRLKQIVDENDYIARTGGDEFLIISQNISDFEEYDNKIRRIINVFSYPFALSTAERFVSASIGIAIAPKDGRTTSAIMKHANVAMRNAKAKGRNTYVYFEESMNEHITEKIQIQSELRKGFEENEFILYYEPIISLEDNKISGFEALVAWNHPTMGILHPDEFMMYAKDSSVAIPIGIWAFKEACNQLKQWEEKGYTSANLSYYLSLLEFKDTEMVSNIWDIVTNNKVNPKSITLEISEATALDDIEYTRATISKLNELGISFCLDKFGTEYCAIKYLDKFALASVKIDKELSKSILEEPEKQTTLAVIIKLLKTFKVDVIVESVDKEVQEEFLRSTESDFVQGAAFSIPVLAEDTMDLLEAEYININKE